jgi:hypothetical protein
MGFYAEALGNWENSMEETARLERSLSIQAALPYAGKLSR